MKEMSKVKVTCKKCGDEFVLPGIEVETKAFNEGKLKNPMLSAIHFKCTHCGEFNTFTFDELSLVTS